MTPLARQRLSVLASSLVRLLILVAVASATAALFGAVAGLVVAVAGLVVLLAVHVTYASLLAAWLESPRLEDLPNGVGIWSDVFARLYRARRATDLNERRLQDNEERFRRTISALPEGIVLLDPALQIEWCNPVAEQHLGITLSGDHGLRITNLVRDPEFVNFLMDARFDTPLEFSPMGRPSTALEARVIEVERVRWMVITRDITQHEKVDAMRRDFIANVSHELRTPLTVVNGFVEVLMDAPPQDAATRDVHLKLMHGQTQRMHRLVEDLLVLSRLESRESPLAEEWIDLDPLMREIADEAGVLSGSRHRITVHGTDVQLRGSREELRSAFGNLVSNAVRYTPDGGSIALQWRADSQGGRFEVSDTGIGIAEDHIPRLTERFYRVDKSRSRETGGTGLGLAIVKHVLLRHDAQLDIRSVVGEGSTFSAVFPASRVRRVEQPAAQAA